MARCVLGCVAEVMVQARAFLSIQLSVDPDYKSHENPLPVGEFIIVDLNFLCKYGGNDVNGALSMMVPLLHTPRSQPTLNPASPAYPHSINRLKTGSKLI